ncbi:expressed unknown protein [Seminavis robusta]|uniref:CENP-V/GFA domain-containing protein n=1 Tax=Seminavis robusta TaxID=568900 RepID=A0A9N8HBN7_9STRA|nr:expressed unknown protein [Seminavis robusta]|eukprot:Sro285_g108030.1 n/a (210) ;mRNA; r:594-1223
MASATCQCGKVAIQFTSSKPRVSTECCCDSCFNRVGFLADRRRRGSSSPEDTSNSGKPIVNMKWDNRVTIVRGRDQLFAYKLTPETKVFNIATKCCHSFLFGRNDTYDAHCLTTNEADLVWGDQYQRIQPSSRWFVNQWTDARRATLEPLMGIWVDSEGNLDGEKGWEAVFENHLAAMNAPILKDAVGETFDEILQSLGRIEIVSELDK